MKPIIIRQISFKEVILCGLIYSLLPLYIILVEQRFDIIYFTMLCIMVVLCLIIWNFGKALEISNNTFTFKNSIFSKSHSLPLATIEKITPHYVAGDLLYFNIILTTGETIKMTSASKNIKNEILRVLEKESLLY